MKSNIVYLVNIRDECLIFCLVLVKDLKMKHIIILIVSFATLLVLSARGENEHTLSAAERMRGDRKCSGEGAKETKSRIVAMSPYDF